MSHAQDIWFESFLENELRHRGKLHAVIAADTLSNTAGPLYGREGQIMNLCVNGFRPEHELFHVASNIIKAKLARAIIITPGF